MPSGPLPLIDFEHQHSVQECKVMSDKDIGGFSSAALTHHPVTTDSSQAAEASSDNTQVARSQAYALFSGTISTALPRDNSQVQRTGFAGWRNHDRPATIFGRSLWNLDAYTHIGMRVRSDGRRYFVNIQTESIVAEDLHQHRLHCSTPGQWETVLIDLSAFVRTNHGELVEPQAEMLREKVRSIGLSLTDRVPGPFEIAIGRIWASVGKNDETMWRP